MPFTHSIFGSTSLPSPSTGFKILKTAKIVAMFKNNVISAKCAPGQTLLPKPKVNLNGSSCALSPKCRDGSNVDGFGYTSSSCAIALYGEESENCSNE